jgi:cation:H+ antiporter
MMIQATIPTSLGLFFTPWLFSRELVVSAVITALAILYLLGLFARRRVDARALIPLFGLYAVFMTIVMFVL